LWEKCKKQKVELARAKADLALSNETVTTLKLRNANLSKKLESYRRDAELTEHHLQEVYADEPIIAYDIKVRVYRYIVKIKSRGLFNITVNHTERH
jgi:hypothetical protein